MNVVRLVQENGVPNIQKKLWYADDNSEISLANFEVGDRIYSINDDELYQVEYDTSTEQEYSGEVVSFEADEDDRISSLEVEINPIQDLHGQDAPYPAGGGVNKANLAGATAAFTPSYGLTTTVDIEHETITISGIFTGSSTSVSFQSFTAPNIPTDLRYKAYEITSGDHLLSTGVRFMSGNDFAVDLKNLVPNSAINIQIRMVAYEGSTAPTKWSPYSNECPISGWTGLNLDRVGKNFIEVIQSNLCPSNNSKWHTYGENGCTLEKDASGEYGVIFPVQPNTKYYIGFDTTNTKLYIRCAVYSEMPTAYNSSSRISVLISNSGQAGDQRYEITTPAGAKYAFFGIYRAYGASAKYLNKFFATTELPNEYTPYQGTTYPVSWQTEAGTVYGCSINLTTGVLTVELQAYIFTGNEIMGINIIGDHNRFSSAVFTENADWTIDTQYNTHFKAASTPVTTNADDNTMTCYTNKNAYWRADAFATVEAMQAYFAAQYANGTPVMHVCRLATPITYQLDPVTVNLLLGQNNIWAGSTNTTIKLITNNKTLFTLNPHS